MNDIERGAMKAPQHAMPPPAPIRPNGNPTGVVEKGIGKDPRSGVVLASIEGANFHGAHLLLTGCLRLANRVTSANAPLSTGSWLRVRMSRSPSATTLTTT